MCDVRDERGRTRDERTQARRDGQYRRQVGNVTNSRLPCVTGSMAVKYELTKSFGRPSEIESIHGFQVLEDPVRKVGNWLVMCENNPHFSGHLPGRPSGRSRNCNLLTSTGFLCVVSRFLRPTRRSFLLDRRMIRAKNPRLFWPLSPSRSRFPNTMRRNHD